ncbi:MAG: class I SAM-dependent methyltransferase [Chloroflexi bacterium]|nr:class I SAM-dependent methyltransferase [Chloroflexota bacterium]
MEYLFRPPPLPSFKRFINLYRDNPDDSVLRVLEYEILQKSPIAGRILDVGGGKKAHYLKHLPEGLQIESVNIDPVIEPTWLIEPGAPFPVADSSFDNVICMNTLEHIYDVHPVLKEMFRVLKTGGVAYISVPFMFRIHAHPDDYFRATPSWWRESIRIAGFSRLELQPLIWGRSTAGGLISNYNGLLPRYLSRLWAHLYDLLYAKIMFLNKNSYSGARGLRVCSVASGYFISAIK